MILALNGPLIERHDAAGRPLSLTSRWTDKPAVLFTGDAGLGTTAELNRAHRAAESSGALVLRVKASGSEPLENRFARAVTDQLGALRKAHGWRRTRELKRTVRALTRPITETTPSPGVRTPPGPLGLFPQFEIKGKDKLRLKPPATLNELADAAGAIAAAEGKPAMIVIDDIHRASPRDLAAINELAEHLEQSGQPVLLAMSGGETAPTLLHKASRGADGRASDVSRLYDIRRCERFSDRELRPVLHHALAQAVPGHYRDTYCPPQQQEAMLRAANGNAGRLSDIVNAAVSASEHGRYPIDARVADWAMRAVETGRNVAYEAAWNDSTPYEKKLMLQVARQGSFGLDITAAIQEIAPGDLNAWAAFDEARQSLDGRGLSDTSTDGRQLTFASPGMQRWVAHHNPSSGQPAPGVEQQAGPSQQLVPPHLMPGSRQSGQAPPGSQRRGGAATPGVASVPRSAPSAGRSGLYPLPGAGGPRQAGEYVGRHRQAEQGCC